MTRFLFLLVGSIVACTALATTLPDVPEIGLASPGDGSATVSFTPGRLGSGRLVEYMVVCNNNVQSGAASPITVTGLTNGTAYGCRARVTTTVGTTPWSELSNIVTPRAATADVSDRKHSLIWIVGILGFVGVATGLAAWRRRFSSQTEPLLQTPVARRASDVLMLWMMSVLWIPGVVAFGMYATGKKIIDPSAPLIGVVENKIPLSGGLHSLMNGRFQKEIAARVFNWMPFYASITHFFNQAQYTLLRASSNREILVGRDGYLFHPSYASTYCKRDITAAAPTLEAWAKMILEIQNGFQKKGKNFLYILTPSKVEYMSDKLPFGYPCPSKERDIFISEALKYLALAGVNYVDANSKMSEIQQRYGYEPFPKGGIHWTDLAAMDATNEIINKMNRLTGKPIATPYRPKIEDAPEASWEEQDFVNLLNLKWPLPANKTAKIVREESTTKSCSSQYSIVVVGNSFFTSLGRNLVAGSCPPSVRQLFYFSAHQRHFYYKNNAPNFDIEKMDFNLLESSDVIILEEHAGIFSTASYTPLLHKYITDGVLPKTVQR